MVGARVADAHPAHVLAPDQGNLPTSEYIILMELCKYSGDLVIILALCGGAGRVVADGALDHHGLAVRALDKGVDM